MGTPERIEHVSKDPSLAIAADYGRITIHDVWYRYDPQTDCLIRCPTLLTPAQSALFENTIHEQQL